MLFADCVASVRLYQGILTVSAHLFLFAPAADWILHTSTLVLWEIWLDIHIKGGLRFFPSLSAVRLCASNIT